MPAPAAAAAWWAPEALNFGTKLVGGLLGGESEEEKERKRQGAFERRMAERESGARIEDRNRDLGSRAYMNPMKAALLAKMGQGAGLPVQDMKLPDASTYRRPMMSDPRVAEERQKIIESTRQGQYRGDFRNEALRRFDEAVKRSGGQLSPRYNRAALYEQLKKQMGMGSGWMPRGGGR